MPQDQILLVILGVLVAVNVLLLISIPFRLRRPRPAVDPTEPGDGATVADAPSAAEIEAFVAGVPPEAAGAFQAPVPKLVAQPDTEPHSETEPLARLADHATWSRAIHEESDRVARFGHPATVVMAELPNLDRLIGAFGRGVADRVALETARVLASEGREADRVAWLGEARFGILLSETAETAADAYIKRVRAATGSWLESVGLSTRVSFGWASPDEGGSVTSAAAVAEERMHEASRAAAQA